MSTPVFVDTGAWISLLWKQDTLYQHTRDHLQKLRKENRSLVTTSAVLLEVLDGLASHKLRYLSPIFRHQLMAFPLSIVYVNEELFQRGWDFYEARSDKDWSLTDCLSFVVMQERGITEALAHDHHFEQAGFRALLRE